MTTELELKNKKLAKTKQKAASTLGSEEEHQMSGLETNKDRIMEWNAHVYSNGCFKM